MFIVTFYSFKGGVGRTMALVNAGIELARSGQRVLMVDFDLEAPGLDTFDLGRPLKASPGMVDYVTDYLKTGKAPDVSNFIYRSPFQQTEKGGLWIMPSGKQDSFYQARFNSIDWKELYEKRDGFLLFENLKAQWKQYLNLDYVLVDSRTGHTDTSGICTRQLPDAVMMFFFPNEQNRRGLQQIVEQVRKETNIRNKKISLNFVMSNVPDLDDEDQILEASVRTMKETLVHGEIDAMIHHYNSLALLNQTIFVSERPRSRLAQEYRELVRIIRSQNTEDRETVLKFLSTLRREPAQGKRAMSVTLIEEQLEQIRAKHADDAEVLKSLAKLRGDQHKFDEATIILEQAGALQPKDPGLLVLRAEMYFIKKETDRATADLIQFLDLGGASYFELSRAVRMLVSLNPNLASHVIGSHALKSLSISEQTEIAYELLSPSIDLSVPEAIFRALEVDAKENANDSSAVRHRLSLCLIAQSRFREAAAYIASERPDPSTLKIHEAFNYAIAEWGMTGIPPKDLFARVIECAVNPSPQESANFSQCLAIAHWVCGDFARASMYLDEARKKMNARPKHEFTAWRFVAVPSDQFINDLDAMEQMFRGEKVTPVIFSNRIVAQKTG